MEQANVHPPEITKGPGYPIYYSMYLQGASYLLRKATAWYSGAGEAFTYHGVVDTPNLGEGLARYSACLPTGYIHGMKSLPLVLVIEGGGFVLGQPSDGERHDRLLSDKLQAVVLSVDYAKAPEYPYPHALLQSYRVLQWCFSPSAAKELGSNIDPSRVAILGNSAGGNLAAALSLLTSFTEGPCAKFRSGLPSDFRQVAQVLLYPSVGCNRPYRSRFARANAKERGKSLPIWVAELMEASYLPPSVDKDQIFIAPLSAKVELLEQLRRNIAPVACYVAGLDCLKVEAIEYCEKLKAAGVKVHTEVYANAVHGFTHYPEGSKNFRESDVEGCWDHVFRSLQIVFRGVS